MDNHRLTLTDGKMITIQGELVAKIQKESNQKREGTLYRRITTHSIYQTATGSFIYYQQETEVGLGLLHGSIMELPSIHAVDQWLRIQTPCVADALISAYLDGVTGGLTTK